MEQLQTNLGELKTEITTVKNKVDKLDEKVSTLITGITNIADELSKPKYIAPVALLLSIISILISIL